MKSVIVNEAKSESSCSMSRSPRRTHVCELAGKFNFGPGSSAADMVAAAAALMKTDAPGAHSPKSSSRPERAGKELLNPMKSPLERAKETIERARTAMR